MTISNERLELINKDAWEINGINEVEAMASELLQLRGTALHNADDLRAKDRELEELRKANVLTYQQAKKAVELFESEYIGQNQKYLWDWAVNEVLDK